jgi:TonB family protein
MNRSFRRVCSGTAVVHLLAVALFVVVQLCLLGARPLKLKEDIQMFDLSGPAGGDGGGEPEPVAPPEHKIPDLKPPEVVAPPEPTKDDTIPEPVKPKPKPKIVKAKPQPKPVPQVKAPPSRTNQMAKAKSSRPKLSAEQVRALLSGSVRSVGSTSHGVIGRSSVGNSLGSGSGSGSGGPDSPVAWYYAMVKQIMYEAWQQPSGLANAGNPITTVTIRVKRDGTISDWQMMRPSGSALMDESVKRAVQSVKRLKPLPPQFIGPSQDITIQFELEKLLL